MIPAPMPAAQPLSRMVPMTVGAERFKAVWQRCVASPPSPRAAAVYSDLHGLYTAPCRRFHNLDHITDCLRWADELAPLLQDPDAVEMALWFHDAIYDVGTTTNERRSAEMFLAHSSGASFGFRHRVCSLIMATRHAHRVHGNDRSYMVDIDLSGFGAPWDVFMANGARLREESAAVSDAQYHAGQVFFLSRLQRRPQFFATEYFRDRYEAVARENLRRVLDELTRKGYAAATS
jgi:predicted metal-dependent HD superfamily phosphohydrolase